MHLSLHKLTVMNFRSVRQPIAIDFTNTPAGLYYICGTNLTGERLGSNGSGKSTLFSYALIWVLTGALPRANRPGSRVENWQAERDTTKVEVEFSLDNNIHRLTRTRRPNDLILDGRKIEQDEVNVLLRLSPATIRCSVLIDQFAEMFLALRPDTQAKMFSDALDLQQWITAADYAGNQAKTIEKKALDIDSRFARNDAVLNEVRTQLVQLAADEQRIEDTINDRIDQTKRDLAASKRRAMQLRESLDHLRGDASDALYDARMRSNNHRRSELRRLEREHAVMAARIDGFRQLRRQIEVKFDNYHTSREICPECGQKVSREHIEQKLDDLQCQLDVVLRKHNEDKKSDDVLQKEINELETKIQEEDGALSDYIVHLAKISKASEQSLAADHEVHSLQAKLVELDNEPNPYTVQHKAAVKRVDELSAINDALKLDSTALHKEANKYIFWERGFREIRLQLIDEVLTELAMVSTNHAEALGLEGWRIEFATERETVSGAVKSEFTTNLYEPDHDEPVEWELYSGGESHRWQLAVTFGLSEVLLSRAGIDIDFEVIDEPTEHLSPEGVEDLLSCLSDRARDTSRRIFLIDHQALDRGLFDGVISVIHDRSRGTYIGDDGGVFTVKKAAASRVRIDG